LHAKNEASQQPAINLQIARAYLAATDPQIATRTWQFVMDETARLKQGTTQDRWVRAMRDQAFDPIRQLPVLETRPEHFLRVLGKPSRTNSTGSSISISSLASRVSSHPLAVGQANRSVCQLPVKAVLVLDRLLVAAF
jgi:hypothetical protein